jgi:hypothetical protein
MELSDIQQKIRDVYGLDVTKTGDRNVEAAYARHFVRVQSKRAHQPPNSALEPSAPMRT